MKKLILKGLLFVALGFPLFAATHGYVYTHWRRPIPYLIWDAIEKASRSQPYQRVIVGDSVARQLFDDHNQKRSRYFHLTTNAATTLLGHYILLMEYLKHNALEEIVVLLNPYSLMDNLDRKFTANYVVGSFCREKYRPYITPYAEQQIKNCTWWFVPVLLRNFPEFCLINYQEVNPKPFYNDAYLSPLSLEYLQMLKQTCQSRGISLRVVCPPLSEQHINLDYSFMKEQVAAHDLTECFSGYFDIKYMPTSKFGDELHPKPEYLDEARALLGIQWELSCEFPEVP